MLDDVLFHLLEAGLGHVGFNGLVEWLIFAFNLAVDVQLFLLQLLVDHHYLVQSFEVLVVELIFQVVDHLSAVAKLEVYSFNLLLQVLIVLLHLTDESL